jgi:S-DNA-T family DNA segregation ATPase FtsK/SpoIIIE
VFESLTIEERKLAVKACAIIKTVGRASVSCFQRRMRIGYTQAARIMDFLEENGVVGVMDPRLGYERPVYADKLGEALK